MGLDENLAAAIKVATSVRLEVPNSSNTAFQSSYTSVGQGVVNAVPLSKLNAVRSGLSKELPTTPNGWLEAFREIQGRCLKAGVGNCGELAAIACLRLRELRLYPVEYVKIADGVSSNPAIPHLIAVIGRVANPAPGRWPSTGQALGLPDSWDAAAVICDPWDRVAYPAHDYQPYWAGLRKHSSSPNTLTCTLLHQI